MEYTYEKWEHTSFFNEHIRYLNGTQFGMLSLPFKAKDIRYQDSGRYVCSVSNGVPDIDGRYFQNAQITVLSQGKIECIAILNFSTR